MQRAQVINKKSYTPRDRLLKDRRNYILKVDAIVPSNSYLVSTIPSEISYNIEEYIINEINKIKSGHIEINDNYIRNVIHKIKSLQKSESRNVFPSVNKKYFMPGSSIKGAVRSRIEYKFIPKEGKSMSCYIVEDDFNPRYAVNHMKFWGERVAIPRWSCDPSREDNICIVCDIFGSKLISSLVNFGDAYMIKGDIERLNEFNGIEAAKPNSRFELEVTCFNFDYVRLGILFLGLELFSKSPIIMGMFKYRYNPNITNKLFRGKYAIGLLRFELKKVIDDLGEDYSPEKVIQEAKNALENSEYNEYIDWEVGVIKY